MGFCQPEVIVKDSQACRLSNAGGADREPYTTEMVVLRALTELPQQIVCDRPSRPSIINAVGSSFLKAFAPLLHCQLSECFWSIHRLEFCPDLFGFEPFESNKPNDCSLLHDFL
jgi:hypothetical protein